MTHKKNKKTKTGTKEQTNGEEKIKRNGAEAEKKVPKEQPLVKKTESKIASRPKSNTSQQQSKAKINKKSSVLSCKNIFIGLIVVFFAIFLGAFQFSDEVQQTIDKYIHPDVLLYVRTLFEQISANTPLKNIPNDISDMKSKQETYDDHNIEDSLLIDDVEDELQLSDRIDNQNVNWEAVKKQANVEVKKEEPKVEVKKEEPKVEVKKEEPKVEVKKPKAEVKKEEPKKEKKKEEPKIELKKDEPKVEVKKEEPKAEVKKEEPKVEVKKEEPKVEVKKEEPKVEVKKEEPKAEVKKEEPKAEVKKEEPKEEVKKEQPKVEVKKEEPKVELKKEEPKVELKKEEPKIEVKKEEPKVEVKKEQPKVEVKKEEPKVELKKEEPKVELKKEEPKIEVKKEEPKVEVKKQEPKVELKKDEPKVELKKEEPKIEVKKEEPKVELKKDEPKVEVKVEEPKAEVKKEEPKAEVKKEEPKVEVKKEEPKTEVKKEEPKAELKKEEPKIEAKKEEPKIEVKKNVSKIEIRKTYKFSSITNDADLEISDELDEADSLFNEEKYEDAVIKYDVILRKHLTSPRAYYGKGLALDKLGFKYMSNEYLERAIDFLARVLDLQNVPDDLYKLAGRKLADRQQFRGWGGESIKTYKKMCEKFPDDLSLKNEFGVSYMMVGQNERAREIFQDVLVKNPNSGFAKVHLGFILKARDNRLEEAVKYLREGIKTQEPGTIDGRFYLHLGDSLIRLGNETEARKYFKEGQEKGLFLSEWQRSLYNVNSLTGRPWWTAEQTGYQKYLNLLQENWKTIRDEGLAQLDPATGSFLPEEENLRETGDWKQFTLFQQGRKNVKNCEKAPKTCALIDQIPDAKSCKRGQVKFSVMSPGIHVWPHVGPTNCRIRAHLGLVVPEGPSIRVVNDTRTWKEGQFIIFDDSFEHEVWHKGKELRLVLIVDFWHPELTDAQKRGLSAI